MADTAKLDALQKKVSEFVAREKTRIENEVSVLESVLSGRTGGSGIQEEAVEIVSEVAYNDLASFLAEG